MKKKAPTCRKKRKSAHFYFDKKAKHRNVPRKMYIADHDFADGINTGSYEYIGFVTPLGSNYTSAFGYSEKYDWAFIPSEIKGNSALPIGDMTWNLNNGWYIAAAMGGFNETSEKTGFYTLSINNRSNIHARHAGARLIYIPQPITTQEVTAND